MAIEADGDRVWVLDVVEDELHLGSFDVDGSPEALDKTVGPAREGEQGWRGALAVDAGEAWVTDGSGTLARYLPDVGELEPVDARVDVVDVDIAGRWAWVGTADGRLLRFDRTSPAVTEVHVSDSAIVEVVVAGSNVWTADEEGEVRRIPDDATEARASLGLDPGRKVLAAALDGTAVYVANAKTGLVERIDAVSGEADPARRIDLTAGF